MKRIISLILSAALLLSCLAILGSCGTPTPEGNTTYVAVDINPEVELVLDNENKVVSFRCANEDAQVMFYGEASLEGLDAEAAVKKITELAIEYGYLAEDNTVVGLSVAADKDAKRLEAKLTDAVKAQATADSFELTVDTAASYSVNRRLEALKEKYPDNERIQSITVPEFKLALSATKNGEISIEAAVEMDTTELVNYVNERYTKMEQFATDAFNEARDAAQAAYDYSVGIAEDLVYYEYLAKKALSNPTAFVNGGAYQAYMMIARSLDTFAIAWDYLEELSNKELNEEQIALAVEALGLEDATAIKDSNGNVTIASIEAYADKTFKNSEEGQELTAMMNELTASLEEVESEISAAVQETLAEYKPQIEAVINAAKSVLEAIESLLTLAPAAVKETIDIIVTDFEDIASKLDEVTADGLSSADLRTVADMFEEKATEAKEKMSLELTEEELAEIEEKKAAVLEKMADAKAALDKAIDDAETSAKEYLAARKNRITEALK